MTTEKKILRVGTRGSLLAVSQTHLVLDMLREANPGIDFEITTIKTSGDEGHLEVLGAFVKEVEHALLRNEIDLAIHSLKDMPTALPSGVVIGAMPKRGEPRDCLISREYKKLYELPRGARIGTSSLRRAYQLKSRRPDLEIVPIRGNIITRMNKVENLDVDAVVLAAAGLERVDMDSRIAEIFSYEEMLPAVSQGILAIEVRSDDRETFDIVQKIHDPESELAARAERAFLLALGGGCRMPIAAFAEIEGGKMELDGLLCNEKGDRMERATVKGDAQQPEELGKQLADVLLERFGKNPL